MTPNMIIIIVIASCLLKRRMCCIHCPQNREEFTLFKPKLYTSIKQHLLLYTLSKLCSEYMYVVAINLSSHYLQWSTEWHT